MYCVATYRSQPYQKVFTPCNITKKCYGFPNPGEFTRQEVNSFLYASKSVKAPVTGKVRILAQEFTCSFRLVSSWSNLTDGCRINPVAGTVEQLVINCITSDCYKVISVSSSVVKSSKLLFILFASTASRYGKMFNAISFL